MRGWEGTHCFISCAGTHQAIDPRQQQQQQLTPLSTTTPKPNTGVYLPYSLPRRFLTKTPLLLAFDNFHFTPLVPMDPGKAARVPLVKGAT